MGVMLERGDSYYPNENETELVGDSNAGEDFTVDSADEPTDGKWIIPVMIINYQEHWHTAKYEMEKIYGKGLNVQTS